MRRYLLRRLLAAPALLLGVLTLTFLLVHAAPGEPFAADPAAGLDPHAAGRLRAVFGADLPLHIRYLRWMEAAVRFDLGISYTHRRPVVEVLGSALGPTLILMFSALALAVLCGVAAALAAVTARSALASRALTALAVTAYASPGFWIGVLLVQVVSVRLGWLPASGWRSIDPAGGGLAGSLLDVARHLLLPSLTLAAPAAGGIALHLRAALEESLAGAVTLGELARGASRRRIALLHLRNAAAPVLTLLGFAVPGLVGGSLIVEVLFAWPGMGRITYEAILARDLPVILAAVGLSSVLTVAGSLAADLGCAWADPRVTLVASDPGAAGRS